MKHEEHVKSAVNMKIRHKVEELEENIDELEDVVQSAFPIVLMAFFICAFLVAMFAFRVYLRMSTPNPSKKMMDGKTVLITGATGGIGKATAIELAKKGARVLMTGRDKNKVEAIARQIRKKTDNQHVNALHLDLGNLRSICEFAEDYRHNEKFCHVLINNAAYMGPPSKTSDILERNFGVNYLGHFYLTYLLSDKLKKNAPSRIINVVSDAYRQGVIDLEDLALNKNYTVYGAYARSKLCQVLFNQECHKRFFSHCVWSFAVHPGACSTELMRSYPGVMGKILRVASRVMFKPPEDGCQTIVWAACADGLRDYSGKILANCKPIKTAKIKNQEELSKALWNASANLCGFEGDVDMPEDEEEAPATDAAKTEDAALTKEDPPKEIPPVMKKEQ